MSKKDKKIKLLKKEVKALKAELRKLKLASIRRRGNKMAKVLRRPQAPVLTLNDIEKSPNLSAETKKVSAGLVGQH